MRRLINWLRDWWAWIRYRRASIQLLQEALPDEFGAKVVAVNGSKVRIELPHDLPAANTPVTKVGGIWVCTGCLEATSKCKCPK